MGLRNKHFIIKPVNKIIDDIPDLDAQRKEKKHRHSVPHMVKGLLKKQKKTDEEKLRKAEETKDKTYHSQTAKISELLIKLKWMESKQEGKVKRIAKLESQPFSSLTVNVDDKILLKGLRNSLNRLEAKILATNNEISRRRSTIDLLGVKKETVDEAIASELSCTASPYSELTLKKQESFASNQEKVNELREKIRWMERKQMGKHIRMEALKEVKDCLSFEERVQLKGLKKSSKKLDIQIAAAERHLSWQVNIIEKESNFLGHSVEGEDLELVDIEYDSDFEL